MEIKRIIGHHYSLTAVMMLYRLDKWAAKSLPRIPGKLQEAINRLKFLCRIVFRGANKGMRLQRTGNVWRDRRNFISFKLMYWLDRLDTLVFYRDRKVQAQFGRVRNQGERRIADFLSERKIRFIYEYPVNVGNNCYTPDFFLPVEGVFIEYFGLMNSDEYRLRHDRKLHDYRKANIPVIVLYPRHLGRLEPELSSQLEKLREQPAPSSST